MAPRDDNNSKEWKPKLVRPPEKDPGGRICLDLCESKVEEWKENAIKMQEAHVKDNNRTEWFAYASHQRDVMELRILISVYGMRIPQDSKGCPSSPFQTYSPEEKDHARKIKKMIVRNSSSTGEVFLSVIYVSVVTKDEVTGEFAVTEEPVFVVRNNSDRKFIDKNARVYENFEDYKANNSLPKGFMLYPQNGSYSNADKDGKVALELAETPNASTFSRVMAVMDTVVSIGGIVLTVTGLVSGFGLVKFSEVALKVIQTGSFVLSGYTLARSIHGIYEKTSRNESIHTECLLLLSSALSAYVGVSSQRWKSLAREGKTFGQLEISRFQKCLFATANIFTCISSISSLLSSIYDVWKKNAFTWQDFYRICMGAYFTANVLMKPIFVQQVFENEQKQCLNEKHSCLTSDDAKAEMDKMMTEHDSSDQKAYMIRNLNVIENHNEFFELIKTTGSNVVCTADGLLVNNQINIDPTAYNGIGKDVIVNNINQLKLKTDELNRLKGLPDASEMEREEADEELRECEKSRNKLINSLKTGCNDEQSADVEKLGELIESDVNGTITPEEKVKLDELTNKCSRHRKQYFFQSSSNHQNDPNYHETMNRLERETAGGHTLEEWKIIKESLDVNQEDYQQRSEEVDRGMKKAEDFQRFQREVYNDSRQKISNVNDLMTKFEDKLPPDVDPDLKARIFENVKNHVSFKSDIDTFTNGQNERLCYKIDVDQVKRNLQEYFSNPTVGDITINGGKIFANMNVSDYDRLNRVLKECKPDEAKSYMIAASKIANDREFAGQVKTPQDMASVVEAIQKHKGTIPKSQTKQYLNSLTTGSGDYYESFRSCFNERIQAVELLDETVKSQWGSSLGMAYHWWKHEGDFEINKKLTVEEYFIEKHNNLFQTTNMVAVSYTQCGGHVRITYCQMFGTRIHIGFKVGTDKSTASHFVKTKVL